jgi:hypothetical protein
MLEDIQVGILCDQALTNAVRRRLTVIMLIRPTRRSTTGLLIIGGWRLNAQQPSGQPLTPPERQRPPRQDLETVQSFVRLSHSDQNMNRVAEMIAREPQLVYAAWDWGGGDWETGLGGASHIGSRKMARLLLEKGARIDAFCAAMLGERAVVTALLAANPAVASSRGPHGHSLLYHAAISGDTAMAEAVVGHLAQRAPDCNQALNAAVRDGHVPMTRWLLNNGVANPNQMDGLGKRPLATAAAKGFSEIAEELRKHGATE